MTTAKLLQLDPAKVLVADNIRFAILTHTLDALKESIVERGGVHTPVMVTELPKGAANGYTHQLVAGFRRHAAVTALRKAGNPDLTLPAVVTSVADDTERLMLQVSENMDRDNLSPIDQAVAAQKMLDAGISRDRVLAAFSRPTGRKGLSMQPASRAWLRQTLKFLELPKGIQERIHDGRVTVKTAWELLRVPADKREEVLTKAEELRQAEMDREERDSERDAKSEEKAGASTAKLTEAQTAAEKAQLDRTAAVTAHDEKTKAIQALRLKSQTRFAELENEQDALKGEAKTEAKARADKEKEALGEQMAAAKKELRDSEKVVSETGKALDKAEKALKAITEPRAAKPAPTAKAAKAGDPEAKKPVAAPAKAKQTATIANVKAAVKATGGKVGPLDITELRKALSVLADSKTKKVATIGAILVKVAEGKLTAKDAGEALALVK